MISLKTAWWLARAETRRARGTLAFCVLSIALGVMAITAIRSLTDGLRDSARRSARGGGAGVTKTEGTAGRGARRIRAGG